MQDHLFLLHPPFQNPEYPGKQFYCRHCAMLEGLLSSSPELASGLEVHRIAWPRPRAEIVGLLGAEHQSLPVLVLKEGDRSSHQQGVVNGRAYVDDLMSILAALTERHGFPWPHP